MNAIVDINTTGTAVDLLVACGVKAGLASEIVAKVFELGLRSGKPVKKVKSKQLDLIERETTWPAGFLLTPELVRYATDRGFDLASVHRFWDSFRDHHQSIGSKFIKWDGAWRTWINKRVEWRAKDAGARQVSGNFIDGRL